MLTVGLTGGIGSGKSTVSERFAELGAVVVDADQIAREVVAPGTPGLAEVVMEFGSGVLTAEGELDRARLGALVFADAQRRAALNAIVHPLVGERSAELAAAAADDSIVVHDVPLITENRLQELYDVIVVVDASEEDQLDRLVRLRGMTPQDARARIAAQASRAQRRAIADLVVMNDGSLDDLRRRVDEVWRQLVAGAR